MKEEIGEKIRQARVKQNLSQDNIAFALGISTGAYSNIERGKSEVTVSRLYLIAKILKIHITELLVLLPEENTSTPAYKPLSEQESLQINELTAQVNELKSEIAGIKQFYSKKRPRK